MKDFLGNPIRIGDRILSFANYHGSSAHYFTATVNRITEKRVYYTCAIGGHVLLQEWTVPHKCVVINKLIYNGVICNSHNYCPNCGQVLGIWTPDKEKKPNNIHITECPKCNIKLDVFCKIRDEICQ